jgi:LPXTG-site transpeptidase (sortase) family protein
MPLGRMKRSLRLRKGSLWPKKRMPVILPVVILLAGGYLLLLLYAPEMYMPKTAKTWNIPVSHHASQLREDRVYIPKLKLNLSYKTGSEDVLLHNLWHRYPERGDPKKGGNFILAGHRFEMGATPGQTAQRSPLYHVDALIIGDKIYVDFEGVRYLYEVIDRFKVRPDQAEIEDESATPKMTLYTCTFQGSNDGREVVIAKLRQKNIDPTLEF